MMPLEQARSKGSFLRRRGFRAFANERPEVQKFMREHARRHPHFLRAVAADTRCACIHLGRPLASGSRAGLGYATAALCMKHDGFAGLVAYRAKARLQGLGLSALSRIAHRLAIGLGNVAIGDPVFVEPGIYLPHGNVVIDGFVHIGAGTAIRPFVTIGLREADPQGPKIGRKVLVGTGARILGPVVIGDGARIGANSFVLADVPARATAVGTPARVVRTNIVTVTREQAVSARNMRKRASAAEAEGRVADAIAEWTALNRMCPDAEVEERLARLRCYGAADVARKPQPIAPVRSPQSGDPFPDAAAQIPEIRATDLSLELLSGGLLQHGSLLVRGLVDPRLACALTEATDKAFDARAAGADAAPLAETRPWYTPCTAWDELSGGKSHAARKWARDCNTLQLVDAPRALVRVVEAFEEAGLTDLITAYLGDTILWSANKTTLRRVTPDANASWHQDGYFMGSAVRAIDVWVALNSCGPGTGAPGIAVVPQRVNELLEAGGRGAPLKTALSLQDVERASGGVTVTPTFEPGDALLLDEHTLHSTDGSKPTWAVPRFALEAWAFAVSTFPDSYVPFMI